MKKIHNDKPKRGVVLGKPFDDAIEKYLLRYALAQEIARRNNGKIPKACKDMLKEFTADLDV